jgi:hypothetical protein
MLKLLLLALVLSGCAYQQCPSCFEHPKDCIDFYNQDIQTVQEGNLDRIFGFLLIRNKCPVAQRSIIGDMVYTLNGQPVYSERIANLNFLRPTEFQRIDINFTRPHFQTQTEYVLDFTSQDV